MTTRKLGLLGLMLGATLLGTACDETTTVTPPVPVTLNLLPDAATLTVGQTLAMTVVVTNSTNQAATFVSSNPAAATVNATTGVVTAVAAGITVITATSAADANAKDASTITVNAVVPPPTPSISIKSVTTGNLNVPVNPSNVFGQIDVTLNVTVPTGAPVQRVETLIDGNVVCSQSFTSTGEITVDQDEADSADEIVCPIPTNAFNATTGVPTFPNGSHALSARLVQPNGNIISTPSTTLIFNNQNFVNVTFAGQRSANSSAGPRSLQPVGSQWLGGDITATVLSVNYSGTTTNLASLTISMMSSGQGVTGLAGCVTTNDALTDPTIADIDGGNGPVGGSFPSCAAAPLSKTVTAANGAPFTVVFPANALLTAGGVQGVEDFFNGSGIVVNSVTSGGQAGPVCINPNPNTNPQNTTCAGGTPAFPNPIRVDNLAPRVTQLNIVRPNQYYNGQFVPSQAAASQVAAAAPPATCTAPCARTVDYGVDNQTAAGNTKFFAGPAAGPLVDVTANFGPLPESLTANTNVFNLQTTDALTNSRSVFATAVSTTVSTSQTGTNLLFGIDNTAPTQAVAGPPNNSTNCMFAPPSNPASCAGQTGWTVSFSDAGIGPSGFNANPVQTKLELILAAGTTCYNANTAPATALANCTTNAGFVADDGVSVLPTTNGYWRITTAVTDAANNTSTQSIIVTLNDNVAPVAGGISSPASIAGGAAVTFSSALQDNVELGDVTGATTFTAAGFTLIDSRQPIGTYGPDAIVNTSPGTFNIAAFVRSVETTAAGGLPTGAVSPATIFEYAARDVAGVQLNNLVADGCPPAGAADGTTTQNCILRNVNISAAVNLGSSNTFPAFTALNTANGTNPLWGLFLQAAPSNAIVCTKANAVACAPAQPFTTTLTATVTGQAAVFANPFSRVVFAFQDANGRWVPIGTAAVTVTDNTVTSTRTFTYTLTWTPTGLPSYAAPVRAIGVASTGSALLSGTQVVTLTAT